MVQLAAPGKDQDYGPALWKKFHVTVAGRTGGAHEAIVERLRKSGHTEVSSPEDSDYLLVFCPVASRVGTDIGEALQIAPAGKPVILVVMHHTFNPNHIVADSRRQVDNPRVRLTVDYLFYEGKLLTSNRNDIAWNEIQKFLGLPVFLESICPFPIPREYEKHWGKIVLAGIVVVLIILFRTVTVPTIPDVDSICQGFISSSWKKFHVIEAGKTEGAHEAIVETFRDIGHTEVSSREDSDYLLVFCSVASRVGTDISEALQNIPAGKPVILVVMHHTFNPDHIVADSRRQVDKPNVCLTVDYLFYEDGLLTSKRNDDAWSEIKKFLRVPVSSVMT